MHKHINYYIFLEGFGKMTKKELKNMGYKVCRAGYCELQTVLNHSDNVVKIGSGSGVYGWNWSAYVVPTTNGAPVIVCTGYRDLVGERVDGIARFEEKARAIYNAGEERKNAIALGDYIASKIKK